MRKVKVFCSGQSTGEENMEEKINLWIDETGAIVTQVSQVQRAPGRYLITLLYEPKQPA